jgi:type I restriction enzyme S subunit
MTSTSVADRVPLGQVAVCQYGLSAPADPTGERLYIGMGQLKNGRVVAEGANRLTVSEDQAAKYALRLGDVLFNRTNSLEWVGKTAIVNDPDVVGSVFASYLVRLIVDENKYDPRFLNLWLNTRESVMNLRRLATPGVAQYNIRPSLLSDRFLVPAWPLSRQRVVADVEALFEKFSHLLDRQATASQAFMRGLAQELLTGKKRFPDFQGNEWRVCALGELVQPMPRRVPKPAGQFLSAGVRSHGKGVFLKREFQSVEIALDELFELKSRDLVVNITFGWEGAVAIVPPEADGALVSHRFPTYVVNESKILVEFLRHVIRSKRFVFDVGVASPGGAGRNRVLNRSEFLNIALAIPSIDEQRQIAEVLNTCDLEIALLTKQRQQIEAYKRALLSRLLSGQIVVPS